LKLLADTSALLATLWDDDERHRDARSLLRRNPQARFVLTELILAELVTRLRTLTGSARAVAAGSELLESKRYELIFADTELIRGGLARMARFADKRLSLTDCVSFELMEKLGIPAAFTFDRDFRDCGFRMVP
jgi:predicted nucleic acid-binding protein